MKKPRTRGGRTAAAKNHSRRQGADHRLLAGGGRSFQIASRDGRGRRRGRYGLEEQVPDASGAGLRRREQDAIDDRLAAARRNAGSLNRRGDARRNPASGSPSAVLLTRQPVGQGHRLLGWLLGAGARLLCGPCGAAHVAARLPRARAATPSASPCCRARPWPRRRVRPCRTSRPGRPCHLVGAGLGAITILFRHFRSVSFSRPWSS